MSDEKFTPESNDEHLKDEGENNKEETSIFEMILQLTSKFTKKITGLIPNVTEKNKSGLHLRNFVQEAKKKISHEKQKEPQKEQKEGRKKDIEKVKNLIESIVNRPINLPDMPKKDLIENDIIRVWEEYFREIEIIFLEINVQFPESLPDHGPQRGGDKFEETEKFIEEYLEKNLVPEIQELVNYVKKNSYDDTEKYLEKILKNLEDLFKKGDIINFIKEKNPGEWTTVIEKNSMLETYIKTTKTKKQNNNPKQFLASLLFTSNLNKYITNLIAVLSAKIFIGSNVPHEQGIKTTIHILAKLHAVLDQYRSALSRYREFQKQEKD